MSGWKRLCGAVGVFVYTLILSCLFSISFGQAKVSALAYPVTGTVTNASTSAGVGGTYVYAYTPGTTTVRYTATTQTNGTYSIYAESGTYDFRFVPPAATGLNSVVERNVSVAGNVTLDQALTTARNTFSGTLTDQNGTGLANVNMSLRDAYSNYVYGTTDANGGFSMAVQPGKYSLSLYGSNVAGIYSFSLSQTGAPTLDLTTGNLVQNLQMQVATVNYTAYNAQGYLSPYSRVTTQANGSNFTVSLYAGGPAYSVSINSNTVNTDAYGKGSFKTLVGVTYSGANTGNGICNYANNGNTFVGCNTTPLTVTAGTNTVVTPQLPAAPNTFSGTLTDQNGTGLANVNMSLRDAYSNYVYGTTDANGGFSMAVQPGKYSLSLYGSNVAGIYSFSLSQTGAPTLDLTTGNLVQNLQMQVATVNYTAYNAQGYLSPYSRVTTQANGSNFTVSLYAGGPAYSVSINSNTVNTDAYGKGSFKTLVGVTYSGANTGNGICNYANNGNTFVGCNTTPLTVTAGTNTVVTPQLPAAPNTFSGTLTDQNGTGLANVNMSLRDAYSNYVYGTTDANGGFSMAVQPGKYSLSLYGSNVAGIYSFSLSQTGAPTLDLTTGNLVQNLQMQVATVNYTAYNAQGYLSPYSRVTTQANGSNFTVSLYAGGPAYSVSINSNTVNTDAYGKGSFKTLVGVTYSGANTGNGICNYANNGNTFVGCNTTPLTVTAGTNTVVTPQLPAAPNTFSGTLTDQNGTGLANVNMSLRDAYSNYVYGTTDANGGFSMAVQPGKYSLSLYGSNVAGIYAFNLTQNSSTPTLDLTTGNLVQNLQLQVATVDFTANNTSLTPIPYAKVTAQASGSSFSVHLYAGDPGYSVSINSGTANADYQARGSFKTIVGVVYGTSSGNGICDYTSAGSLVACISAPLTVTNGINNIAIPQAPAGPAAPTGLNASSPTSYPVLNWQAVSGAAYYRIYRGGVQIGTSSTTSFGDNNIANGTYSYYVAAVSSAGGQSSASNTISVTVAIAPPTLTAPTLSANPIVTGQSTTLTTQVSGNLYGVLGGEYFIGTADPGQGNGIATAYNNGTLTAVISGLAPGNYVINVRVQNSAGWSQIVSRLVYVRTVAPTNVYAESPTHLVALTWDSVAYASAYEIYRNGSKIGTSTTNSYTDTTAPIATNSYYVVALNPDGYQSVPSNVINVTYAGPLHTISGQVIFNGTAASGVLVDTNTVDGPSGYSVTDGSGTYNVYNLADGNYSVTVANPANSAVSASYAPNYFTITSGQPFIVVNGSNVAQNLSFNTKALTITVKNGQGFTLNGSRVTLVNVTDGLIYTANGAQVFNLSHGNLQDIGFTGADGTVVMYVFPGVTYKICASFPQLNDMSHSSPYCMPVTITVDSDTTYEAVLPASYTVSGHISFEGTSVPAGGAKVIISSSDNSIQQIVLSDANGNYTVDYLPDGVYNVQFVNNGSGPGGNIPQSWNFTKNAAITVNGSNITQNFEFATKLVHVDVIDGAGAVIPNAYVYLVAQSGNPVGTLDGTLTFNLTTGTTIAYGTATNGEITLAVFPGQQYQVCARVSTGTYCKSPYLTVDADMSAVVVAAQTYNVGGTVVINGNPVPQTGSNPGVPSGANVALSNTYTESAKTDASGNYSVGNLINGTYTTTVSYSGAGYNSATTQLPDSFTLTSAQRYATVNGSNATHNIAFNTYPVIVKVYDGTNSLLAGSLILAAGAGQVVTLDGSMVFYANSIQARASSITGDSPVFYLFAGASYDICTTISGGQYCARGVVVSSTSANIVEIRIAAPTGLTVAAITSYPQDPVLYWNAMPTAVSYNIYRDGVLIGTSMTTSFTDSGVAEGNYVYRVQAVYLNSVTSALSDLKSTVVDKTAPVVASVDWINNPSLFNSTVPKVTVHFNDSLTNIVAGEYFVGDTDPGVGQGISMLASGLDLTTSFSWTNYPPGTYLITMRGKNTAGIWSDIATATFTVDLPAPTGLHAATPAYTYPVINWSAVNGAQYYTVYRNGVDIGSSNTTSYTDMGAQAGTNTYTVVAISLLGIQSEHSASINVLYDPNPPVITAHYNPSQVNGWNNSSVTLSFTCEAFYGVASCPGSVVVSQEGANQEVTVTATDNLGGSTTSTFIVNLDRTAPNVGAPSLSADPIYYSQTTTLTATATDGLSGIAGGEYFIGSDPGLGNGTAMAWDGANLTAILGSTLASGVYTVSVRSVDVAGNWSDITTITLTIILAAPTNLTATSPAQFPALTWTESEGAVSYNVYRNGSMIGSTAGTSYMDANAPDGTNAYIVKAVDAAGNESQPSNTVEVLVNSVPPTTTATLSPNPYAQDGTYPDPVTVTLHASAVPGITVVATYYTIDGGAQQTYFAPFTVLGPGSHTITYWSVDNAGVVEAVNTQTFTIHANLAPVINPMANATINEGSSYSVNGSFGDYDSSSWTATVDYGDGTGMQPLVLSGTNFSLSHVYADDGIYVVRVTVSDGQGASSVVTATITVNNVAATVGDITGIPISPIQMNAAGIASVNGSITFTDPGILDTHTAVWDWGDGTISTGIVTEGNGSGTVTGSHNYTAPGIYIVTVTITDNGGLSTVRKFYYANIYNPAPGSMFMAGVKFGSPKDAYTADPALTGSVNFSVNVRYDSNGSPTGSVSMFFAAGHIDFKSTSLSMLVCTEDGVGTLTGSGTVNGVGGYTFLVSGIDRREEDGNTVRFQIIASNGNVIYDTQPGDVITEDPTTDVTAGTVIVQ